MVNGRHLVTTVEDLGRRGVLFRSLSDPIDTSTASGRLMLGVFGSFAQLERDLIAERTTAGMAALRAAGTPLGRPTQVHPEQVELFHALAVEGKSYRRIAQLTGLSCAQIGRVLRGEIASLEATNRSRPRCLTRTPRTTSSRGGPHDGGRKGRGLLAADGEGVDPWVVRVRIVALERPLPRRVPAWARDPGSPYPCHRYRRHQSRALAPDRSGSGSRVGRRRRGPRRATLSLADPSTHRDHGRAARGALTPHEPMGRSVSRRGRPAPRPVRHRSPANQVRHDDQPLPARIADRVTAVFGSWAFILVQTALIIVWLSYNGYVAVRYLRSGAFDPYPFILLNLLFSTQAAYAAPLILLSQNRTAERDRVKAEHDFDVNILALRALAELLGDMHDPGTQQELLRRIDELLGTDATTEPRGSTPSGPQ